MSSTNNSGRYGILTPSPSPSFNNHLVVNTSQKPQMSDFLGKGLAPLYGAGFTWRIGGLSK